MAPPHPRRVLGIDPGTLRLGYALLEERPGGTARLVVSGVLAAAPGRPAAERLGKFFRELEAVVAAWQPTEIAVESSFFGENARSMLRLGEARGCALILAGVHGLSAHDYPPASVKKAVTGHGNASKAQVARMLLRLLPELAEAGEVGPLDRTDAIAVAWCHLLETRARDCAARVEVAAAAGVRRGDAVASRRIGSAPRAGASDLDGRRLVEAWRRRRR